MRFWLTMIAVLLCGFPARAGTLEDIRSNGVLQCGVDATVEGFSALQTNGIWSGRPVDFCRALAFTAIGDTSKVNFSMLQPTDRVEALQSGEVDVLVSGLPVSLAIESRDGLLFSEALFAVGGENFAAAVRQGDDQWFVIVKWLRHVLTLPNKIADCSMFDTELEIQNNWACLVQDKFGGANWVP